MASKQYIHKEFLYPTILLGIATVVSGFWTFMVLNLRPSELSELVGSILIFIVFGYCFSYGFNLLWKYRDVQKAPTGRYDRTTVKFTSNQIQFPHNYFFRQASFNKRKAIFASEITEVNPNHDLPSFVINDNEIVFLHYERKDDLIGFANRNSLEITDRFEIWSAINMPFVDTEYTETELKKTTIELKQNGIEPNELKDIRDRIGRLMLWRNVFTMHWTGLGQWDYLNWTFLTKKKYWWSMEIALKNYKRKNVTQHQL